MNKRKEQLIEELREDENISDKTVDDLLIERKFIDRTKIFIIISFIVSTIVCILDVKGIIPPILPIPGLFTRGFINQFCYGWLLLSEWGIACILIDSTKGV
ncbi:MAG: hypothetical protein VZS44_10545 [Bacilli bacterium]|nr:hypothetical protein [Bacilli bacterium]